MIKYIDRRETIERYKEEHERLKRLVLSVPEERLLKPNVIGEWSLKDVIAHLAAWNWEAIGEVDRVLKNQSTWPDKYGRGKGEDKFNWQAVEKRRRMTWMEALKDWDESFWAQIERMEKLSEEEWKHQSGYGLWADGTPVTIWSLFAYEYQGEGHEGGHAKQIRELLGGEIDRYLAVTTFTPAVVGYLRDGHRVCLGVRKQVSLGLGENLIAGIGGKVGDSPEVYGETLDEAMDREADEEIGVRVRRKQYMGRVRFIFTHKPSDSTWNQDVGIYSITQWEGTPTETKSTQPLWFVASEIPWGRMWEDNEHWLPKVLAGPPVNAVFLFNDDNKIAEYRFNEEE